MSYDTIEAALLTQIQALDAYDTANAKRGDWRHLGHGKTKAVVLVPGPFTQEDASLRNHTRIRWTIDVELYILWTGEQDTVLASLRTERQSILDRVNLYPYLGGTAGILGALVTGAGSVEAFSSPDGAMFWKQVLNCEVVEDNSFVRQE